jgi:anti-anti-sigma factor
MKIVEEPHGRVLLVTASGRLDGNSSGAFAEKIGSLITGVEPRLLLDCSGIDFVSSAGLRVVLSLLKKVKAANGIFALCAVQASVLEVLDISGFTSMIDVHPGRVDGLAALA